MIVERLYITDHFLRRWLERIEGLDIDGAMSEFYGRPSRRYTAQQMLIMLRHQNIQIDRLRERVAGLVGPAPRSGTIRYGEFVVLSKDGRAVTIKPR